MTKLDLRRCKECGNYKATYFCPRCQRTVSDQAIAQLFAEGDIAGDGPDYIQSEIVICPHCGWSGVIDALCEEKEERTQMRVETDLWLL